MLFFDEADALFGKRTQVRDAHDRYANIEIDYLLQRMEQFDGVAVLATNRKGDLDAAFTRRLRFIIDFAPPTIEERERLWRRSLEASVDTEGRPLMGDVDWPGLARELDLGPGLGIKSAALGAAGSSPAPSRRRSATGTSPPPPAASLEKRRRRNAPPAEDASTGRRQHERREGRKRLRLRLPGADARQGEKHRRSSSPRSSRRRSSPGRAIRRRSNGCASS